jgi:hypothetical protein
MSMADPWEVVTEVPECPPSMLENVDGEPPWEAMMEVSKRPVSTLKKHQR